MKIKGTVNYKSPMSAGLSTLAAGAFLICAAATSTAMELIPKPGVQVNSAEFGTSVARRYHNTLASADQHGSIAPGPEQKPDGISARNGAIYLFSDFSPNPVRTYQYVHTVDRLGFDPGQSNPIQMNLGSNVALSDRWMVATMRYYPIGSGKGTPALFIADREINNGRGPACPEVDGVIDCYGVIEPLLLDDPDINPSRTGFDIAASNRHIVYADAMQGVVQVLTYDESTQSWDKSSNFGSIPAMRGGINVDINNDFLVVAIPPTATDPYSGRVYYSRWRSASGWSSLRTLTSPTPGFGRSVALNTYDGVVVGSGHEGSGAVDFYKRVLTNGFDLQHDGQFSQNGPVTLVAMDGSQAMAFVNGPDQTVKVFRDHVANLEAGSIERQWDEFGRLDKDAVNQLPDHPGDNGFMPTDMALSDGVAVFGWRGLSSPQSVNIVSVGALVRERVADMYDPAADTLGLNTNIAGSGTVVLDEENALLPKNTIVLPQLGNSLNVGWFAQVRDKHGFSAEWPIEVPTAGSYQVCARYLNNSSQDEFMLIQLNGSVRYLAVDLTPTSGGWFDFDDYCFELQMPAGKHAFGVRTFNNSLAFDQFTIE